MVGAVAAAAAGPESPRGRVASFFQRERTREALPGTARLAGGEKALFTIVVREDASPVQQYAGRELQHYLSRITGARFDILPEPGARPAIILGDGPEARQAGIDVSALARDGYSIRIEPTRILIAGNDDPGPKSRILLEHLDKPSNDYVLTSDVAWDFERGTLYGAYRFLEECGCRWFLPGPRGEAITRDPDLSLPSLSLTEEPAFALRVFGRTVWRAAAARHVPLRGMLKKEVAQIGMNGIANRLWLMRVRASSEWFAFNHRPPRTQWEQRFGENHPDYFAVLPDGTRDLQGNAKGRHTGHLCYSQEGVFTETVADIDAYFEGRTAGSRGIPERYTEKDKDNRGWAPNACYGDTVSLLPHDGFRGCRCPECMAKTRTDGPPWQTYSDLVWPFVARVARHVDARFPDKLIICLAYAGYSEVPAGLDLPDNVVVGVCPKTLNKTYNIVADDSYAQLFELVSRLGKANDMPLLFWFHHLYRLGMRQATSYGVPMLLPRFFKRFVTDLAPYGRLFFCELDHDSLMFEHLNRYVVMRLLFAPETDVDALLQDYVERFYGPAAEHIAPILEEVEQRSEQIAASGMGRKEIWGEVYTEEALRRYRSAVEQAAQAVAGTAHKEAVSLFSTYFVGLMEAGRERYVAQFSDPAKKKQATLSARRVDARPTVDGVLSEACWANAETRPLLSNIDGSPTAWEATVRVVYSDDHVTCAFTCDDPRVHAQPGRVPAKDYVELFLAPAPGGSRYYQILVYPSGETLDFLCDSRARKYDGSWRSHAQSAVAVEDGRWTMEVAVPVRSLRQDGGGVTRGKWGANFCRTVMDPPKAQDQFSSFSPFMRGSFRQPDLFGTLVFGK